MHVGYVSVRYAMHESDSADGRLFECAEFAQRVRRLAGESATTAATRSSMSSPARAARRSTARNMPCGRALRCSSRAARRGRSTGTRAGLRAGARPRTRRRDPRGRRPERGRGRSRDRRPSFLLGATPEVGCESVTQFIGLVPPGRAPDHFHRYDEVIYILEGEGVLEIGGEQAPIRPERASTCRARSSTALPTPARRAAAARCLHPGRLPRRGLLPRRHSRRPPRKELTMPRIERTVESSGKGTSPAAGARSRQGPERSPRSRSRCRAGSAAQGARRAPRSCSRRHTEAA